MKKCPKCGNTLGKEDIIKTWKLFNPKLQKLQKVLLYKCGCGKTTREIVLA